MSKLPELTYDSDIGCHIATHDLNGELIEVCVDASENTIDVGRLTDEAQSVVDNWSETHPRMALMVAAELLSAKRIKDASKVTAAKCLPFLLRVYASPDSETSITVAFNVPSVLDDEAEYIDVEEELTGAWSSVEICDVE